MVSFFIESSPIDFLTSTQWSPGHDANSSYGILPLLIGTLLVTLGAMLIAIPLSLGTAIYISEYAPNRLKNILKPVVEMLAAIPSVAIGFLGIVIIGPGISEFFGVANGLNALNGAFLLAIMAMPTMITITEDAINAVPHSYKEASVGLGASKWRTISKVILPAAMPGVIAAIMLGLGRAIGETMTVLMATGNATALPSGFFDSVRTITATIAIEMGEVPYQTTHYFALFAIAGVLFLITMTINSMGEFFARKFRKFHE